MDRINSTTPPSYPINKALSAYASTTRTHRPAGAPYANAPTGVRRNGPIDNASVTRPADPAQSVARIQPSPMTQRADAIGKLVGARVKPIDLNADVTPTDAPKPTVTSAGTYTLYPQAADRIQAATSIASNTGLGRTLDLKG